MGPIPHIMVVDDNSAELPLLQEAFTSAAWSVELEWACHVDQAMIRLLGLAAEGRRPDLLILDIMMASQPSLPLLAGIRSHTHLRAIPCVVISGISPPVLLTQQYLHHGVLRVMQKAQDFPGLVRFVKALRKSMAGHGSVAAGGPQAALEHSD